MKRRISESPNLKKISLFVLLGLTGIVLSLKAQPLDSQEAIAQIESDIVKYLRANEELEVHSNHREYMQRITIIECVDRTVLGYNKVGIYVFSVNTSHTKAYLLLKNNLHYEIVDPDNLVVALQKVATLLNEGKLSNTKVIEYIESIIRIYRMNENRNPAILENK